MAQDPDRSEHAIAAAEALGLTYGVTRHGPVGHSTRRRRRAAWPLLPS